MSIQEERYRLLHRELREQVLPFLGDSPGITVYQSRFDEESSHATIFCGLIPNRFVQDALSNHEWDVHIGDFAPCLTEIATNETAEKAFRYNRYGGQNYDIEPLIIVRFFDEIGEQSIEISEEFRLYHNLFYDEKIRAYVRFDITGELLPIVRVSDYAVEIDRKHLRQFLAAKHMSLALYFESSYHSATTLEQMEILAEDVDFVYQECVYRLSLINNESSKNRDYSSESLIIGKKIIEGLPFEKCGLWPLSKRSERNYVEFIVDTNFDDEPISFTSDPEKLRNLFGKNPDAPLYQTPVFFRRMVLGKYYREHTKYHVVDGHLWCNGFWGMRIDNNHNDYVIAMLGDLGRDLPENEQAHWKHYNVVPDGTFSRTAVPDGTFSRTAVQRWFKLEWADPEDSGLLFKQSFDDFTFAWSMHFGWHLFKPLSEADTHHFKTLRRPLSRELSELNEIAVSLSKVLPEAINTEMLLDQIKATNSATKRSLPRKSFALLKEFLSVSKFRDTDMYVDYLEKVQLLRSASASHRTDNMPAAYENVIEFFKLDKITPIHVADEIFTTLTEFLDRLREHFCPD